MTPSRKRADDEAAESAFVAGKLPETDRRFDFAQKVAEGYLFDKKGVEWNVITPAGRHGAGPSPEEAIKNVDSQILVREGRRVLIRADHSEVPLDAEIVEGV